MRHKKHQAN